MNFAFALILLATAARVEAAVTGRAANPLLAASRRLEVDQQEQLDDQVLFGSSNIKGESSLSSQLMMAEMDKAPIDFNLSLDTIQAQIDAARRNIDTTLPNNVRISALNAYINNAVVMNKLGMLDDAEDESLINPNAESYIEDRKARKLTKSIRGKVAVGVKKSTKFFRPEGGVKAVKRAKVFTPKSRKLVKASTPVATENAPVISSADTHLEDQHVTEAVSTSPPQERRLAQQWTAREPVDHHIPPKPKNYHVSQIKKLRANDELMELAKTGSLFKIDMASIYKVSDDDLNRYMDREEAAKHRSI